MQSSGSYKFTKNSKGLDIGRNPRLAGLSSEFVHSVPTSLSSPVYDLPRGSINSNADSMSFNSEYDVSLVESTDSLSSHPSLSNQVKVYGATAFSPTGSESRVLLTDFDAFPVSMTCTECEEDVVTDVRYRSGRLTWTLCGVIALFGGVLGCCLIPCCIKSFKDVAHVCPHCGTVLGMYKPKASCMS